jgi:hypothetical protein
MVIFINNGNSGLITGRGVVLILNNSPDHTSSARNLAGWLLYYSEILREAKEIGVVAWYRSDGYIAKKRGEDLRNKFFAST